MSVEDDLRRVNEALDNFESLHNIPVAKPPGTEQELAKYITLSIEDIERLDSQTCAEISYFLSQYSFYIQRVSNRTTGNLRWLDRKLIEYTFNKLNDYDKYTKFDHKIYLIAQENEVVKQLLKAKAYEEQIQARLEFIASSIRHMADVMKNLQVSKR